MEGLLSNGPELEHVPEKYVFPPDQRPGDDEIKSLDIPVIDLSLTDKGQLVDRIIKAGKEFGFFQVINHGMPDEVVNGMMRAAEEFFDMPMEDKAMYLSNDPTKFPILFASSCYTMKEPFYWRDALRLFCYPVEDFLHLYPEKPAEFRSALARYAADIKALTASILRLIARGLGLEEDYFTGELSGGPVEMYVNRYPRCPDPSLTLGLPRHCDPYLINLLLQGDVRGLQFIHEGKWFFVDPIPNAFVVNVGHLLEFISNGVLKSSEHRAVTNRIQSRTTIATDFKPTDECLIAPARLLARGKNKYRSFCYPEFHRAFISKRGDRVGMMEEFTIKD